MNIEFEDQEKATKAFNANLTVRYCRLDELERWSEGRQYEGLQAWWDDSNDVPLWERAPCIVYPVVSIASKSNAGLCLGSQRFPVFSSAPEEDEGEEDGGLGPDESSTLDRFVRQYQKTSRFRTHARESFLACQACGTSVSIHGVRNGIPFAEGVPAKWCTPTFDENGEVARLEIQYPYVEEYRKGQKWAKRTKLYRRVIDTEKDTEFLPADASENGGDVDWKPNTKRTVEHGLGFCPVVWYAFMRGTTVVGRIDGIPIHVQVLDEIRQHDIARSQWHRGALLSEPQVLEIGVEPGYSPTDVGRTAIIPTSETGGLDVRDPGTVTNGAFVRGGAKKARKKGPGWVWQYPNPTTRVELLQYPPEALGAQENNARDLRIKLQESLGVVFLDPENIKFAATTSGKALEAIKQKQLDQCDDYRIDLEDGFFQPSLSMQLRVAQAVLSKSKKLRVRGAEKVKPILDGMIVEGTWQPPPISCTYGPYYTLGVDEEAKVLEVVRKALGGAGEPAVITLALAVKRIAKIFGIENTQAIVDELTKAQEAKQKTIAKLVAPPPDEPAQADENPKNEEPAPSLTNE